MDKQNEATALPEPLAWASDKLLAERDAWKARAGAAEAGEERLLAERDALRAEVAALRGVLEAIGRCGDPESDRQAARVLANCVKAARAALAARAGEDGR